MNDAHPSHVGHHYVSAEQQFQSGKLGMWLFLATEILLFGGLFVAYAVYRANHPEIFVYAHHFLNKTLGAINTAVLICSSFTMALGVRMAQLGHRRGLILSLMLTLFFACGFLGIKYVEYTDKWKHGLLWGRQYRPHVEHVEHGEATGQMIEAAHEAAEASQDAGLSEAAHEAEAMQTGPAGAEVAPRREERSSIAPAAIGPPGLADEVTIAQSDPHAARARDVANVQLFFGIYFVMTGLHGLHVIAGMVVIGWLIVRSVRGDFGREYFTPVDLGGLYWHLVDLIWIYLFPLLYLIGA